MLGLAPPIVVLNISEKASGSTFYEKGACIDRTIASRYRIDVWNEGLGYHIRKYFQGNPDYADFVNSFVQVTGDSSLRDYWTPWLLQRGFPVVHVERHGESRFFTLTKSPISPVLSGSWIIYDLLIEEFDANLNLNGQYFVDFEQKSLQVTEKYQNTTFVRVNGNFTSFSLTTYADPGDNLQAFILFAQNEYALNVALTGLFGTCATSHTYLVDTVNLIGMLKSKFFSSNYNFDLQVLTLFKTYLLNSVRYSNQFDVAAKFFGDYCEQVMQQLGWEDDNNNGSLQSLASLFSVYFRNEDALQKAYSIYQTGVIGSNVKESVYLAALIVGGSVNNTVESAVAMARIAEDKNECDFLATLIPNFNQTVALQIVTAAYHQGLCQPEGELWEYASQLPEASSIAISAFASKKAIDAIENSSLSNIENIVNSIIINIAFQEKNK